MLDYVLALAALLVGHGIRAARQADLFAAEARPRPFHLMVGLSIGYVVNAVLPFRLGEVTRALYVAVRAKHGVGRVGATILAERLSDLLVVLTGLSVLAVFGGLVPTSPSSLALMAFAILLGVGGGVALNRSRRARRLVWALASPFNDRIRLALAELAWSSARLIAGAAMLRPRFLLLTALMWCAYLLAYARFANAAGVDPPIVAAAMLDSPLRPLLARTQAIGDALVLLATAAALVILVVGLATDRRGIGRAFARVSRFGFHTSSASSAALRDAFVDREDYGAMLRAHFTDSRPLIAQFGLRGLGDAVVHRILPGGSDAITALAEVDRRLVIRKFATGGAATKLDEQARWLDCHAATLPLATVAARSGDASCFRYDMPYIGGPRDLYEVVHTSPASDSVALIEAVVDRVDRHHARHRSPAAPEDMARYVDEKIVANARRALDFARLELPEEYRINGEPFSLAEWSPLLDRAWSLAQIRHREATAVHGDLTIENIIVSPAQGPGWYLIDPNPENLFDSPLIDWAKLMQSLHLGYETLNRGPVARVHEGAVTLHLARSSAYSELHAAYLRLLKDRFGADRVREIHFHEIVNYLRLVPYKLRNQPERALSFVACVSLLLRRYQASHG